MLFGNVNSIGNEINSNQSKKKNKIVNDHQINYILYLLSINLTTYQFIYSRSRGSTKFSALIDKTKYIMAPQLSASFRDIDIYSMLTLNCNPEMVDDIHSLKMMQIGHRISEHTYIHWDTHTNLYKQIMYNCIHIKTQIYIQTNIIVHITYIHMKKMKKSYFSTYTGIQ